MGLLEKVKAALEKDETLLVEKENIAKSVGNDPRWLEHLGLTKSDLIRLQRLGFAVKARYQTKEGPQRVRWIIFKEVLNDL